MMAMSEPEARRLFGSLAEAEEPALARLHARLVAAAAGQGISRRALRRAGLHGSNADLGALAAMIRAQPSAGRVPVGSGVAKARRVTVTRTVNPGASSGEQVA